MAKCPGAPRPAAAPMWCRLAIGRPDDRLRMPFGRTSDARRRRRTPCRVRQNCRPVRRRDDQAVLAVPSAVARVSWSNTRYFPRSGRWAEAPIGESTSHDAGGRAGLLEPRRVLRLRRVVLRARGAPEFRTDLVVVNRTSIRRPPVANRRTRHGLSEHAAFRAAGRAGAALRWFAGRLPRRQGRGVLCPASNGLPARRRASACFAGRGVQRRTL